MTEVRARAARVKGQLNFETELRAALFACGDDDTALPETVRVLDEIVTDFVIETCHSAARNATYSNRQKIKVDDFKFAIRKSESMLGRIQDMAARQAYIDKTRRGHFKNQTAEGFQGLERGGANAKKLLKDMTGDANIVGSGGDGTAGSGTGTGAGAGAEDDGPDPPKKRRKKKAGGNDTVVIQR